MSLRTAMIGVILTAVAALLGASGALASSRPSFNMRIVPPECTIDIIDDGLGPVQVITCPPPDPPDEPDDDTETPPAPDAGTDTDTPPQTPPVQSTRRIYSSSDMVDLLTMFSTQGLNPSVSGGITIPQRSTDIKTQNKTESGYSGMEVALALVAAALAVGGILYVLALPGVKRFLWRLLGRKK